jgi:hypothetical protein
MRISVAEATFQKVPLAIPAAKAVKADARAAPFQKKNYVGTPLDRIE